MCGRGCAAARNRRAVGASDRFVGQLGERVLQREPASLAGDEIQKLPVKPHRAWRAQTVAAAERSLRMLSVRRGIAADELQGAISLYGENRAGVPARERDRKSTRLNSSHLVISYAVFCLKKKKKKYNKH